MSAVVVIPGINHDCVRDARRALSRTPYCLCPVPSFLLCLTIATKMFTIQRRTLPKADFECFTKKHKPNYKYFREREEKRGVHLTISHSSSSVTRPRLYNKPSALSKAFNMLRQSYDAWGQSTLTQARS